MFIKKLGSKVSLWVAAMLLSLKASAQSIPMAEEMSGGVDDTTNIFDWLRELTSDAAGLAFFGIGGIAFGIVLYGIIMKVIEWRKEKIELGELINYSAISIVVLVIVFVILGFARTAMA